MLSTIILAAALSVIPAQAPGDIGLCGNSQVAAQIILDLNTAISNGRWPMIPTGNGGANVDLRGQVLDYQVISDNGAHDRVVLDCTLNLQRQGGEQMIRIIYTRNIANQLLFSIKTLN